MLKLLKFAAVMAALGLGADSAPSDMVLVPEGPAILGGIGQASMAGPVRHDVAAFRIDRTEVTNAAYARFIAATGHPEPAFADDPAFNAPDQPVTGVTWQDARAFCAWAGKRLPSEVEWEKAARGNDGRVYPWGDEEARTRAYLAGEQPEPVTARPGDVSPYGVLGMAGNVSEWVDDSRVAFGVCEGGPVIAQSVGSELSFRAYIKGNNWSGLPHMTKAQHRLWDYTDTVAEFIGFRCAQSATEVAGSTD